MRYWFYMLDGLSAYSALLILTFIANMFPLIGSFVKERRAPVPFWQWLITIISCLSIFDKPTVTQQHGWKQHLYAFAYFSSFLLLISVSVQTTSCTQKLHLFHLSEIVFLFANCLQNSIKKVKKVFTPSQHHCLYVSVTEKFWDTHLWPSCCSHSCFRLWEHFCNLADELSTLIHWYENQYACTLS